MNLDRSTGAMTQILLHCLLVTEYVPCLLVTESSTSCKDSQSVQKRRFSGQVESKSPISTSTLEQTSAEAPCCQNGRMLLL